MRETAKEKAARRQEIIDAKRADLATTPPLDPESKPQRDTAVVALRVAGLSLGDIADQLGISPTTVSSVLKRDEHRAVMRLVRDVAKLEAVVQGLRLQRRYLNGLETLPLDARHANAHAQIANAFGKVFDKAALAAGEATERTETRSIALTIDAKREMFESLRESQELRFAREGIAEAALEPAVAPEAGGSQ